MIAIAVHIVFICLTGMTMQAQPVKEMPLETPKTEQIIKEKAPAVPVQPEKPLTTPFPAL